MIYLLVEKRARKKKYWLPWNDSEKAAVKETFEEYFNKKELPGKHSIEECISRNDCLSQRTWSVVKDYIRNCQNKMRKI
jgi:hypothetical protein